MAIYYCHPCGKYVDDDYHPGEELDGDLVCPDCYAECEERAELDAASPFEDRTWSQVCRVSLTNGIKPLETKK